MQKMEKEQTPIGITMYHRRNIDINSIQQKQLLPKYLSRTTHFWPPILPEPWPGQCICPSASSCNNNGPRASRTSRSGLDMRFSIAWQIWGLESELVNLAQGSKDGPRMVQGWSMDGPAWSRAFAPLDTFCLFGSMSTRTMRLASSMPGLGFHSLLYRCQVGSLMMSDDV